MPPRKRAKTAHTASPTPPNQIKTPTPAEDDADEQLLNDPWTDDEEIGLFKGLIKYKPTGIHKHFRLLALHQYMLDSGYSHPKAEHTKPAGIWRKLEKLYQLESLDERENARQLEKVEIPAKYKDSQGSSERESSEEDEDADAYSEAANKIDNDEFDLMDSELAQMKWERRLPVKQKRDESPPELPELNMDDEAPMHFTPSKETLSLEPSENATPTTGRGRGRAGTLTGKQKPAPAPNTSKRRSARQAGSVADEAEQDEEKEEEVDEEEQESGEEESEEAESEESTPAPRSTRNAKGARGRGAANTKAQGRGRPKRR